MSIAQRVVPVLMLLGLLLPAGRSNGQALDAPPKVGLPFPPMPPMPPVKLDEASEVWLRMLLKNVMNKNEVIRESARAGVSAIGMSAIPFLKKVAEGNDEELVAAAKEMIQRIEQASRGFPGGPPGGMTPFMESILKSLKLPEKQEEKLKELLTAHQNKVRMALQKSFEGGKPDIETFQKTLKDLNAMLIKDLSGVLDKDQLAEIEKILNRAPMMPGLPGGFPGGGFPPPGGFPPKQ